MARKEETIAELVEAPVSEAVPVEEEKLEVDEVIAREDGTVGLGNSFFLPKSEALAGVESRKYRVKGFPIGVKP